MAEFSIILPLKQDEQEWESVCKSLVSLPVKHDIIFVSTAEVDILLLEKKIKDVLIRPFIIISSQAGRAKQMNAGAQHSQKEWLWFLHADSKISRNYLKVIEKVMEEPRFHIFYFDLRFQSEKKISWMFINSVGVWFRSRIFKLPFGDQGLFMSRKTFMRLGQFPEHIKVGEDLEFIQTAKSFDTPIGPIGCYIKTSPRKYIEKGWWKTTCFHLAFTFRKKKRLEINRH